MPSSRHHLLHCGALAILASCYVSERAFNIPFTSPNDVGEVRVWVTPDPVVTLAGTWMLYFDTILWPIDSVESLATIISDDNEVRVRGILRKIGAVLLPFVSAYTEERVSLQQAVLGFRSRGPFRDPVSLTLPCEPTLAQLREALATALAHRTDGSCLQDIRELVASRVVDMEILTKGNR